MIASLVPGGLGAFQNLAEPDKVDWRRRAIDTTRKNCADNGRVAVVAGHLMFWSEGEETGQLVHTPNDLDTFAHILYLDIPAEAIAQRRLEDTARTQDYNLSCAKGKLFEILGAEKPLRAVLLLEAARALAAEDTGELFWAIATKSEHALRQLKGPFGGPPGHSYTALRQAALQYEETADEQEYDALCDVVASAVILYPEFVSLLQLVAEQDHVGSVIVTCGLHC
ncbi:hypothetical protein DL769_000465 [Monosporascus sp. CRB-8-3]|nr:hypothetical protein DL769_000465 [Monosporascus sp. CRB-8-3]